MIKIDLKQRKRELLGVITILLVVVIGMSIYKYTTFRSGFEIVDELGGNVFPSAILSVATTDAQVIQPIEQPSTYRSCRNSFFLSFRIGICIGETAEGIYHLS